MKLPQSFLAKMAPLLGAEFNPFLASYETEKTNGLRLNLVKARQEPLPFATTPIPWVREGFFYEANDRPGKHPYHDAGVYYIQEPSAMAVGQLLAAQPGETVLDLCAAPGGKTTHIASHMQQQGLLVTNEIHPARAKILAQNVERMGIRNAVVTNEAPAKLATRFPAFFDRIMVDAPCSGEGMFRKDPEACDHWSEASVLQCAERQADILADAATMLKAGGRIVYSTCTFSPEENEATIAAFITSHPNFVIETVDRYEGFDAGRPDWVANAVPNLEATIRIWPHKLQGEGHYMAVLRKTDGADEPKRVYPKALPPVKEYEQFAAETLHTSFAGTFTLFGDNLYRLPDGMIAFDKLKVVRPGLHLGTVKKNRFEPSHSLALALTPEDVRYTINFAHDSAELKAYLRGETLPYDGAKGWYLVTVDGYSLGWAKLANGQLKNHYPKGLRWT